MSKGDTYESDLLKLLLNATAIANVADNAASSPLNTLWVSLHTADPGETGQAGTNEVALTAYTRVATTRSTGATGWSITNNSASPVGAITFPMLTSTSTGTATHFAVVATSLTTGGKIFYSGTISPNISLGQNVTPILTTGSSITED